MQRTSTNVIGALLLLGITPLISLCTPASVQSIDKSSKTVGTSLAEHASSSTSTEIETRPSVSANEIDTDEFMIRRISVGMETYINSQTPVVNFEVPKNADWVEITRCSTNLSIRGISNTTRIEDIELANLSPLEEEQLFKNNDYWNIANKSGCEQVTSGTVIPNFYDSWAPSGSFRYLLRACVSADRLTDTTIIGNRNCSRQIAVSGPTLDYVNTREKAQKDALSDANVASSEILAILRTAKQQADTYACYIQWCECGTTANDQSICQRDEKGLPKSCDNGEYARQVDKKKKDAVTMLVAIGLDIALAAATTPSIGPLSLLMNSVAISGMSFSVMFKSLVVQTQDFPRVCSKGIALDSQMSTTAKAVQAAKAKYDYSMCKVQSISAQTGAAAGTDAAAGDNKLDCSGTDTTGGGQNQ